MLVIIDGLRFCEYRQIPSHLWGEAEMERANLQRPPGTFPLVSFCVLGP